MINLEKYQIGDPILFDSGYGQVLNGTIQSFRKQGGLPALIVKDFVFEKEYVIYPNQIICRLK